jgi:hypothetical protein
MSTEKNTQTANSIVDNLFDVGEAWASYGLKVAELAVGTSARTLESVAKALGALSEQLKKEDDKPVIDAPAS